jgi:diaminopimelate epimerase
MSARIAFSKMSGAGNDFVVLDAETWGALPGDRAAWVRAVCRRGLAVGADGVLAVGRVGDGRVSVAFFNPDGGEAFCGNGSRCAARYAAARGLAPASGMTLATSVGDVPAVVAEGVVRLTLPPPADRGPVRLETSRGQVRGRHVIAGVPHLVVPVTGLRAYPLRDVAPELRRHPALGPDGANVDFVEEDAAGRVHVRTFERGVEDETLSCGTGAVAAGLAARLAGAGETVRIVPASGVELTVILRGEPRNATSAVLSGDARFVFEGRLDPEATPGPA